MKRSLALSLLLALPTVGHAQHTHHDHPEQAQDPAVDTSRVATDHSHHGQHPTSRQTEQNSAHQYMQHTGMQMQGAHSMDDSPSTHKQHDARNGTPPRVTRTRSPDYSDGIAPSHMPGMHMAGNEPLGLLRFDRLEAYSGPDDQQGQSWEMGAWYGRDINRFLLRSEGDHSQGGDTEGNVELLWSHAMSTFWNTEAGIRHDFVPGPDQDWLAFGVSGLAPYFLELRATAYLGSGGQTALQLGASYELRITQRLILEPELEVELFGKDDPERGMESGIDHASGGLRLRYEIRREFAPYIGVIWQREHGQTHRQWVAGLRFWL